MRHYGYELKNDEPIEIVWDVRYFGDADLPGVEPIFKWDDHTYYLRDFIRVHNNPWWSCGHELPEYIHGVLDDGIWRPYDGALFIQLIDNCYVNIYEELDLGEEE